MENLENILDTGGRYLSPSDRQFVTTLLSELEQFQYQASKDRALMFHPLGGFQRYLIHKVTQVFPKLTSFSIGDEKNRRTVVCFKSKSKFQQQQMQGASARPSPRNEYVNSPQRGRDDEMNRRSTPMSRSRESSRNRKKHETETPPSKPAVRNRAESSSHLPKPLREKKKATKRDQMKRSRSLQSSPVHDPDLTDEERGRKKNHHDKRAPRSSSLKPPSRRRERTQSPNVSEDDVRPRRGGNIRPNVSDASLHKRGQGLRMEGRVMNGDIEDPYSCGDTESDVGRVDAHAVWKEKERHRQRTPTHEKRRSSPPPRHSYDNSSDDSSTSDESDSRRQPKRKPHEQAHSKRDYESDSDDEIKVAFHHSDDEDASSDNDYNSEATDDHPPSYSSVKRTASLKKAERNLNRIKRADSQRSKPSPERDSTSSESNRGHVRSKRSSSSTRPSKESAHPKRSATLPKSMKEPGKKVSTAKRSQTLKTTGSNTSPRSKTQATQSEYVNVKPTKTKDVPTRSSSTKDRNKAKSSHPKHPTNTTEVDGPKRHKEIKDSMDDLVNGSNSELYIPLPDKPAAKATKSEEKPRKSKQATKTRAPHSAKSAPASPAKSVPSAAARCDGAAQTDVTGTLSRRKKPEKEAPADQPLQGKPAVDFLTAMMQSLGSQPQAAQQQSSPSYPPFNPNNINAFHQFMQNNPPNTQGPFPPLPPHLVHQLYMSWLGAYYAGATGTWPPPAPPSFMLPSSSNSSSGNQMPPFDMSSFLNPSNQPQYSRFEGQEGHHPSERREDREPYFDGYYPPSSQPGNFSSNYNDGEPHKYPYPSRPEKNRGDEPTPPNHSNYENPAFDESYQSNPDLPRSHTSLPNSCHENGHGGSSVVLTDTDTSSVVSKKSEVAVTSNPKGGVMIYVRSQPNSRTNSTGGMYDSRDSLSVSDAPRSVASTPHTSEQGSLPSLSVGEQRKKSSRSKKGSDKNKVPPANSKNGWSSGKAAKTGESVAHDNKKPDDSYPTNHSNHRSSDDVASHADPVLLELNPHDSTASKPTKSSAKPVKSNSASTSSRGSSRSLDASVTSRDGIQNVSQEEIILSLRRAPLATIEDDVDEFFSESQASSILSLNVITEVEKPTKSLEEPLQPVSTSDLPSHSKPIDVVPSTLPDQRDHDDGSSSDSSRSSIILEMQAITPAESEVSGKEESDVDRAKEEFPLPPPEDEISADTAHLSPSMPSRDEEEGSVSNSAEPVSPASHEAIPSPPYSPPQFEVPLIDNSDTDESRSSSSSETKEEEANSADEREITHNGVEPSDASSLSEGSNEHNPSDSSYDADSSRDESSQLRNNLVQEIDGDVVVQAPQFDYYNSLPSADEWEDEKYKKFVEIYKVPPKLSDIEITHYLTKYRGLRLSRVDSTHALCILPTPDVATELLREAFPVFDTRPLSEATEPTKKKAKSKLENDEFELVRATRPKTDPAVAKRMIAASLGGKKKASAGDKRANGAARSSNQ